MKLSFSFTLQSSGNADREEPVMVYDLQPGVPGCSAGRPGSSISPHCGATSLSIHRAAVHGVLLLLYWQQGMFLLLLQVSKCTFLRHSHYILCSTDPDKGLCGLLEEIKKKLTYLPLSGKKLFNYSMSQEKKDCTNILKNRFYWPCILFWWQCLCLVHDLY